MATLSNFTSVENSVLITSRSVAHLANISWKLGEEGEMREAFIFNYLDFYSFVSKLNILKM